MSIPFYMYVEYAIIKSEMQGDAGLIKQVRKKFIPDTRTMAKLAQHKFESANGSVEDVDDVLERLLKSEYQIYLEKRGQVDDNFLSYADEIASDQTFPNIRRILDHYKEVIAAGSDPLISQKNIGRLWTALADSNRQSGVARAGASLMLHISYILQKKGYMPEIDFNRERILGSGCKVDFVFPNETEYNRAPENCFVVACQTTANDRFRLSIAQMPLNRNSRNRTCTAIGCSNFGKNLGPNSLTDNKLEQAKNNNVKFVILASGMTDRLRKSEWVISYNEFIYELSHLRHLWKRRM